MLKELDMKSAKEILIEMIYTFKEYIEEIENEKQDLFLYGEKTAYVECLEIIQEWEESKNFGLDFDIEKKYPL